MAFEMGFYTFIYPVIIFFIAVYVVLRLLPIMKNAEGKLTGKINIIAVILSAILSFFIVTYTPFGRFANYVAVLLIIGFIVWIVMRKK